MSSEVKDSAADSTDLCKWMTNSPAPKKKWNKDTLGNHRGVRSPWDISEGAEDTRPSVTFCFSILPGVPRCKGYVGKVRCGKETC